VFTASRQVWLAGLGAAVVTRDWAEKEASGVFHNLVREGTAVESRAIRRVGDRVESSVTKANVVLKRTRAAIGQVVRTYTDTAMGVVQSLPRLLPESVVVVKRPPRAAKKVSRKTAAKRVRKTATRAKRARKATTKR
jgi:hypothetical protein